MTNGVSSLQNYPSADVTNYYSEISGKRVLSKKRKVALRVQSDAKKQNDFPKENRGVGFLRDRSVSTLW